MRKLLYLTFSIILSTINNINAQTDHIFLKDGKSIQCEIINWTPFYIHWMDVEGDILYDTPLFLVGGFLKSDVEYGVDIGGFPKMVQEYEDYPDILWLIEKYTDNKSVLLVNENKDSELIKVGGYVMRTGDNIKSVAAVSFKKHLLKLSVITGNNIIVTSGLTIPLKWKK